jgi:hypothetical protein
MNRIIGGLAIDGQRARAKQHKSARENRVQLEMNVFLRPIHYFFSSALVSQSKTRKPE